MATKKARPAKGAVSRAIGHRDPSRPGNWVGDNDLDLILMVPMPEQYAPVIGIEVTKLGSKDPRDNALLYSPCFSGDDGKVYADDMKDSIADLCSDYDIPINVATDLIVVALIRHAKESGR